ncbi:MAG: hypothetical protein ABI770_04705 [Sphingomicrobium sp.]
MNVRNETAFASATTRVVAGDDGTNYDNVAAPSPSAASSPRCMPPRRFITLLCLWTAC